MDAHPPKPEPKRCLIARVDYGHEPLPAPRGWREADFDRETPAKALGLPDHPGGLLLRRAEWALAWAGTREGEGLWPRLARIARRSGLALECRFPRHARDLAARMEAEGCRPVLWETDADGSVPPLYRGLGEAETRLHLTYEWETALGAARGGAALLRLALLLARGGPRPAPALAEELGLTAGATRAYLSWMADVALVRRDGRGFDLRHPLLRQLFAPGGAATVAPRPPAPQPAPLPKPARDEKPAVRQPSSVDWD